MTLCKHMSRPPCFLTLHFSKLRSTARLTPPLRYGKLRWVAGCHCKQACMSPTLFSLVIVSKLPCPRPCFLHATFHSAGNCGGTQARDRRCFASQAACIPPTLLFFQQTSPVIHPIQDKHEAEVMQACLQQLTCCSAKCEMSLRSKRISSTKPKQTKLASVC